MLNVVVFNLEEGTEAENKKYSPEQAVAKLRKIDVLIVESKSFYLSELKCDQTRRLQDLEREGQRLKRIVSDLSLEKATLKDVV